MLDIMCIYADPFHEEKQYTVDFLFKAKNLTISHRVKVNVYLFEQETEQEIISERQRSKTCGHHSSLCGQESRQCRDQAGLTRVRC